MLLKNWQFYKRNYKIKKLLYGRSRECHNIIDKNRKLRSFKSSENIQKKEAVPDSIVSNNQFSSVTLSELAMSAREREERERAYYNFGEAVKAQRGRGNLSEQKPHNNK